MNERWLVSSRLAMRSHSHECGTQFVLFISTSLLVNGYYTNTLHTHTHRLHHTLRPRLRIHPRYMLSKRVHSDPCMRIITTPINSTCMRTGDAVNVRGTNTWLSLQFSRVWFATDAKNVRGLLRFSGKPTFADVNNGMWYTWWRFHRSAAIRRFVVYPLSAAPRRLTCMISVQRCVCVSVCHSFVLHKAAWARVCSSHPTLRRCLEITFATYAYMLYRHRLTRVEHQRSS